MIVMSYITILLGTAAIENIVQYMVTDSETWDLLLMKHVAHVKNEVAPTGYFRFKRKVTKSMWSKRWPVFMFIHDVYCCRFFSREFLVQTRC